MASAPRRPGQPRRPRTLNRGLQHRSFYLRPRSAPFEQRVEACAKVAEVLFGNGGYRALYACDDRLKLARLFGINLLYRLGYARVLRAAGDAAQAAREQRRRAAQDVARLLERAADCGLDGLDGRFAARVLRRLVHGLHAVEVERARAIRARLQGVCDEVAEVVSAAREVYGALDFEEVEDLPK